MKAIGVGFVGAGFAAGLHVDALRSVRGVEVRLAAAAATRRERAEAFARAQGVATVHDDWRDLVNDPTVDVVTICVPNAAHAEIAIAAARAGKHVICEKPLTGAFGSSGGLTGEARARAERERAQTSVAEIREAVKAAGVLFLYAENWVYAPALAKTKRLIGLSKGSVLEIRADERHSGSHALRSRRRETAGGGALLMMGSHPIGAALHLKDWEGREATGRPFRPVSVTAEVAALYDTTAMKRSGHEWLVSDWEDVETWANLVIGFEDGTNAVIAASFATLGGARNAFEVYTSNAVYRGSMTPNDALRAYTPDPEAFGEEYLHEKLESRTGWMSAAPDEHWMRGYPQEMQDFMSAIAEGREPASGLDLAGDVVEVIYAGYLSAAEGRRVALGPH